MDALRNALLSELASRAVSFLVSTCGRRLMPVPATVREREEESLMYRLQAPAPAPEERHDRRESQGPARHQPWRAPAAQGPERRDGERPLRPRHRQVRRRRRRRPAGRRGRQQGGCSSVRPVQIHPSQACRCESSSETTATAGPTRWREQTEKSAHMCARPAYLDGYVSLDIRADPTFAWSFIFIY
jgi:hypothetical protein